MPAYFFDSSAIVKRYVQETGTAWIRRQTRRQPAHIPRQFHIILSIELDDVRDYPVHFEFEREVRDAARTKSNRQD